MSPCISVVCAPPSHSFVVLFISSCYLIISVLRQLVSQSASLTLSLWTTSLQVNTITILNPSLSSFLTLAISSLPVNHTSVILIDICGRAWVYCCLCVCPCTGVCSNSFWRHDQSSTANLTQPMKHKQASFRGWRHDPQKTHAHPMLARKRNHDHIRNPTNQVNFLQQRADKNQQSINKRKI